MKRRKIQIHFDRISTNWKCFVCVKSVTMRFVVTRGRKLWDIMTFAAIWPFTIGHMRSVTFAKRLPHAFNLIKKQKKIILLCNNSFWLCHFALAFVSPCVTNRFSIGYLLAHTHTETQCVITIKRQLMFICLFNRGLPQRIHLIRNQWIYFNLLIFTIIRIGSNQESAGMRQARPMAECQMIK